MHPSRLPFAAALVVALAFLAHPAPLAAEQRVAWRGAEPPGTILVDTGERRLYLVTGRGEALRYVVGVGKPGKQWSGTSRIVRKMLKPAFAPPAEVKRDNPWLPDYIRGGAPDNPLGAAALILAHGQYAIHGTNRPGSIGGRVSYGCIRMHNRDILKLFKRVRTGTRVIVR